MYHLPSSLILLSAIFELFKINILFFVRKRLPQMITFLLIGFNLGRSLKSPSRQLGFQQKFLDGKVALFAEKDKLLAEKDARIAESIAEKEARIAEKDILVQAMKNEIDAMKKGMDITEEKYVLEVSILRMLVDTLKGRISSRILLEKSLSDAWALSGGAKMIQNAKPSEKIRRLLSQNESEPGRCAGLIAYLNVVADDNDEDRNSVLGEARTLYKTLSDPVHKIGATDIPKEVPVELFAQKLRGSKATVLAFVGLLKFGGRDITLYQNLELKVPPLILRAPLGCTATEDLIKRQPFV
jgi:hypothetical protein